MPPSRVEIGIVDFSLDVVRTIRIRIEGIGHEYDSSPCIGAEMRRIAERFEGFVEATV